MKSQAALHSLQKQREGFYNVPLFQINIYYLLPLSIAAPDQGDFVCWFPVTAVTWNIQRHHCYSQAMPGSLIFCASADICVTMYHIYKYDIYFHFSAYVLQ